MGYHSAATSPACDREQTWVELSGEEPAIGGREDSESRSDASPQRRVTRSPSRHILVVEDNKADVFLIRDALGTAHVDAELHFVTDGEKAIRFIAEADDRAVPSPSLIILDINLPKRPGGEVLQQLRRSKSCAEAPVVVVTSSDSDQDRAQMARFGANEYFRKSSQYLEYMRLGEVVRRLLDQAEGHSH